MPYLRLGVSFLLLIVMFASPEVKPLEEERAGGSSMRTRNKTKAGDNKDDAPDMKMTGV